MRSEMDSELIMIIMDPSLHRLSLIPLLQEHTLEKTREIRSVYIPVRTFSLRVLMVFKKSPKKNSVFYLSVKLYIHKKCECFHDSDFR